MDGSSLWKTSTKPRMIVQMFAAGGQSWGQGCSSSTVWPCHHSWILGKVPWICNDSHCPATRCCRWISVAHCLGHCNKKNERGGIGPPFHTRCFEGLPFLAICLDFSSFISQDTQFTWKYSTSLCYIDNFLLFLKLFSLLKLEQHGGAWSVMKGAHITNLLKYGCWDSNNFESLLVRETIKTVSPSFETFKRELLSFVSCISLLRFSHRGSILNFTSSAIET